MNTTSAWIHIQVCLLTYKRPELLRQTLHSLRDQVIADPKVKMHLLVVDNDAAGSGKATFDAALAGSPIPARYVCEPSRGIGNARNRALSESDGMDFIAFLDDDEVATPEWLSQLYQTLQRQHADIATGPVTPNFVAAPAWIVRGGFFRMPQRPTGGPIDFVATNNVLFRGEIARSYKFDSRFDATGGEDTHFFMRLRKDGMRLVWSQEAEVIETVPADRTRVRWMLQRAQSEANRYTRCCLDLEDGLGTRSKRLGKALLGAGAGLAMLPLGIIGRKYALRGLLWIARALGTCAALWGTQTIYYQTTPALATTSAAVGKHLE
jgi:succinoglycan biosynthesis protein ExoM